MLFPNVLIAMAKENDEALNSDIFVRNGNMKLWIFYSHAMVYNINRRKQLEHNTLQKQEAEH